MFIDAVYIRLLLVTLLYTVSLLSPDCASQFLEDTQIVLKRSRQGYASPVTNRPKKLQVTKTTETPNYYYYDDDDYYDYYKDYFVTTTTTTTTPPPPRRYRPFGRGRLRNKFRRPILRIRPVIVGNDYTESHEISLQSSSETTQTPSTTSPITVKPRRHYSPREDGRYIDYLSDPNRPRELNGVDLSTYPFYISVPEDIDFKCEGRHDGYYASISHKCQLFHWCFGRQRFDFLCPNYTLYDQTTFTCRFVNKVDCESSELYYDRNNELYVESTGGPEKELKEEKRKSKQKSKNKAKNKNRGKKSDENYEEEKEVYDEGDEDYDDRK
ncbi:uncharacterized protein LOC111086368 [Limulus polyphemus]|uniref:Uncharacterized protein LOC111086368 n=1 Tax=Limulus polyphemus TaxID=6850 RepID=A0ABM1SLZ1_LIMPO|nr:uncharacterized protein LOC111086368 [Limulus polyphemus]